MQNTSFLSDVTFAKEKIETQLMLETSFSKEIRIVLPQGMRMKEHQTPFPIVVQVLVGAIAFGVAGQTLNLGAGDAISLLGGIPHDLYAEENSIVRLSLSKQDKAQRVEEVVS